MLLLDLLFHDLFDFDLVKLNFFEHISQHR